VTYINFRLIIKMYKIICLLFILCFTHIQVFIFIVVKLMFLDMTLHSNLRHSHISHDSNPHLIYKLNKISPVFSLRVLDNFHQPMARTGPLAGTRNFSLWMQWFWNIVTYLLYLKWDNLEHICLYLFWMIYRRDTSANL